MSLVPKLHLRTHRAAKLNFGSREVPKCNSGTSANHLADARRAIRAPLRPAMKETLQVINQMRDAGVIADYAIGGAVGAIAYLEPFLTQDVDVFMSFSTTAAGLIVSPAPIYEYLAARGYRAEREYIRIEGWLVQFLPTERPLYAEALALALGRDVDEVPVRVFSAEHRKEKRNSKSKDRRANKNGIARYLLKPE